MSFDQPKVRNKRSGIDREEERIWISFYRRVRSDSTIATELMAQLEADPEMKRRHLALYLCCKQSLRAYKARQQRDRRIGELLRWLGHCLIVVPIHALQRSGQLALACLPEATREPARLKVRTLAKETESATAQSAVQQAAASPAIATTEAANPIPRDAKTLPGQKSA